VVDVRFRDSIRAMKLLLIVLAALTMTRDAGTAADSESDIRNVLTTQIAAWNRNDVDAFVATYAEDCTFVGKQILHGRSSLSARYKKAYPSPASMGKLSFENLVIRKLDQQVAIATGEWRLDRDVSAGGAAGGVFSLVLESRHGAWQIVLDHTS